MQELLYMVVYMEYDIWGVLYYMIYRWGGV